MFYYLRGKITHIGIDLAVVDCGGVGYACHTSTTTLAQLSMGEEATLYTYTYIREDTFDIYGFATPDELNCFKMLISVSGVGPKAALSVLSVSSPDRLVVSIITGDEKALTVAQGIGKKTAQRVILELKDKLGKPELSAGAAGQGGSATNKREEAYAALTVLGYGHKEITNAINELDMDALSLEDIIRQVLKGMLK